MKILSVAIARAIWLIPTKFLNPGGRSLKPAHNALIERYGFVYSTPLEKLVGPQPESAKFQGGSFVGKKQIPVAIDLELHNDGLVANSQSSTTDSDLFLDDLLGWLHKDYGLNSHLELPIKKIYLSELYVSFDKLPTLLTRETLAFIHEASSLIESEKAGPLGFMGLILATDPEKRERSITLRIEREINTPHKENRIFSSGPLQTDQHLRLLEKLESLG